MLVDIFNKVTALVCAMQVPSLNIVNINVKIEIHYSRLLLLLPH